MATLSLSPRATRIAHGLLVLTALLMLVGCAQDTNPLTDPGAQDSALDTLRSLKFWFLVVVGIGVVTFGASFVSQSWLPEWYQSARMSIRVAGLVLIGCFALFTWIVSEAEAARGAGGVVLAPLAQHALPLIQALPHLLR